MGATCLACGHENRLGRKFCAACGGGLGLTRPGGGCEKEPGDRSCASDGVAVSHAHRAEWHEAIDAVDQALAIIRARRIGLADMPLLLATRARTQLGLGDAPGARSSAQEAIAVAVRCGTQMYEAMARHQLARTLLADLLSGVGQATRIELDRAFSIVEAQGIRAYAPQIHLECARLAHAVGDRQTYDSDIHTAHRLFLDVGAGGRTEEVAAVVR